MERYTREIFMEEAEKFLISRFNLMDRSSIKNEKVLIDYDRCVYAINSIKNMKSNKSTIAMYKNGALKLIASIVSNDIESWAELGLTRSDSKTILFYTLLDQIFESSVVCKSYLYESSIQSFNDDMIKDLCFITSGLFDWELYNQEMVDLISSKIITGDLVITTNEIDSKYIDKILDMANYRSKKTTISDKKKILNKIFGLEYSIKILNSIPKTGNIYYWLRDNVNLNYLVPQLYKSINTKMSKYKEILDAQNDCSIKAIKISEPVLTLDSIIPAYNKEKDFSIYLKYLETELKTNKNKLEKINEELVINPSIRLDDRIAWTSLNKKLFTDSRIIDKISRDRNTASKFDIDDSIKYNVNMNDVEE